jgi:hypothetical protein
VPRIKNISAHVDCLHDGRPLPAYATAEISDEEIAERHYQTRIADGLLIVVSPEDAVEPPAPESPALADLKRDELDELARAKSIESPESLPTKGAVIEAIEAATEKESI